MKKTLMVSILALVWVGHAGNGNVVIGNGNVMSGNGNVVNGNNGSVNGNLNVQIGDYSLIVGNNNFQVGNNQQIVGSNQYQNSIQAQNNQVNSYQSIYSNEYKIEIPVNNLAPPIPISNEFSVQVQQITDQPPQQQLISNDQMVFLLAQRIAFLNSLQNNLRSQMPTNN